jgi:hypothetical protein
MMKGVTRYDISTKGYDELSNYQKHTISTEILAIGIADTAGRCVLSQRNSERKLMGWYRQGLENLRIACLRLSSSY